MPRETVSFVLPSLDVSGDKEEGTSTVSWLARRDWPGAHSCGRKIKKTRVKVLNLGTWNVRTLLDNTNSTGRQRTFSLQCGYSSTQRNTLCRQGPAYRVWWWIHFLLEWSQQHWATRGRCGICHQVSSRPKTCQASRGHQRPPFQIPLGN